MKRCCWGFGGQLCAQLVPAPLVLRRLHREKLARLKVEAADFIRRAPAACVTPLLRRSAEVGIHCQL